jgi:HNH endonuclease
LALTEEQLASQEHEPVLAIPDLSWWLFRDVVVDTRGAPHDELLLRIKHLVLRHEKALSRIRHEVEAFENLSLLPAAKREAIPEVVRIFVWQRDKGKCVKCDSREKLEFDHIIPVVDGGSSTERNVQVFCESCNRGKGRNVS